MKTLFFDMQIVYYKYAHNTNNNSYNTVYHMFDQSLCVRFIENNLFHALERFFRNRLSIPFSYLYIIYIYVYIFSRDNKLDLYRYTRITRISGALWCVQYIGPRPRRCGGPLQISADRTRVER